MTKNYKKIKPHFFSHMKDRAFCFTAWPGDINVRNTIATQGHIDHFYPGGYGSSGDDIPGRTTDDFNSLRCTPRLQNNSTISRSAT